MGIDDGGVARRRVVALESARVSGRLVVGGVIARLGARSTAQARLVGLSPGLEVMVGDIAAMLGCLSQELRLARNVPGRDGGWDNRVVGWVVGVRVRSRAVRRWQLLELGLERRESLVYEVVMWGLVKGGVGVVMQLRSRGRGRGQDIGRGTECTRCSGGGAAPGG